MKKNLLQKPNNSFSKTKSWLKTLAILVLLIFLGNNAFGQAGAALNFDGVDDAVSITNPTNIPIGNSNYTIEAYVNPSQIESNSEMGIVGWGNYGTTNQVNAIRLSSTQIINYWWYSDLTADYAFASNTWYHIAVTYDGTTRSIFVNGILIGSDNPPAHNVPNANNFKIGETNSYQHFNGSIDEVRIWDRGLSQIEIQNNMSCELTAGQTGLVAYYQFNQGVANANNAATTTLTDISGNNNTGTLTNFALNGTTSNWVAPYVIENKVFCSNQATTPIIANLICATADENQSLQLSAPAGFVFTAVPFASFGTPNGSCGNFSLGSCNAASSLSNVEGVVVGKNSATIYASTGVFNDQCFNTSKRLYVEAVFGTVSSWTNDTPSIGLAASGTGTIPSFMSVNTTDSPIVATITVVFNNGSCDSTPQTFTITIDQSTPKTTTATACDSYVWAVDGLTYTTSGTYSFTKDCHLENLELTINSTPAAPTGASTQVYAGTATLADLKVISSTIKWYDSPITRTVLDITTPITDGTTYYASQTGTSCENSSLLAVTAKKISEATQIFCNSATASDLVNTSSTNATWYNSSTGITALAPTEALATGTYYVSQTIPETTTTIFSDPLMSTTNGVAVQADGKILLADSSGIKRMNADGTNPISLGSGFSDPQGVAVQADGTIFVADSFNSVIKRMNADGSNVVSLGSGFSIPYSVAVQADGKILVADTYNGVIKRMNADGSNIVSLSSGFSYPYSVAVQADGKILVADTYLGVIKRMNADGSNVVSLSSEFSYPQGVAVQADGTIFVADTYNGVIKRMNADGSNVVSLGSGFSYPRGVAVQADGTILVTDTGNNVIKKITLESSTNRVAVSVTINQTTTNTTTATACDSYVWAVDGLTYTSSGIKTGPTVNCITEKLDLTITPSSDNVTTVSACDSYSWNGTTYNTSGIKTGPTANCITEKLDLTITPSSDNVTTVSACDSYFWNGTTYTSSGIKTGPTANCITEKLDLTINSTPAPTGNVSQTFCGSETVGLLNATGTGIIWYNAANLGAVVPDSNVIVDGTIYYASQTFSGCESTTRLAVTATVGACLGLDNFDDTNLKWYPNPTTGKLNINYSKTIEEVSVVNLLGQTLFTNKPKANEVQVDLSKLPPATYFIKVVSDGKSKTIKVIKQ